MSAAYPADREEAHGCAAGYGFAYPVLRTVARKQRSVFKATSDGGDNQFAAASTFRPASVRR